MLKDMPWYKSSLEDHHQFRDGGKGKDITTVMKTILSIEHVCQNVLQHRNLNVNVYNSSYNAVEVEIKVERFGDLIRDHFPEPGKATAMLLLAWHGHDA
jgi:hypothetical protein